MKMKIINKFLFLIFMLLILSCEKEDISRNKFAGVWKIKNMTQSHFSCTNQSQNQDSLFSTDDVGVIMLVDRADFGNILDIDFNSFKGRKPTFLKNMEHDKIKSASWSSDYSGTRLKLYNVVYTAEKLSFGSYRITYVKTTNCPESYSFKEEFVIKRVNP